MKRLVLLFAVFLSVPLVLTGQGSKQETEASSAMSGGTDEILANVSG